MLEVGLGTPDVVVAVAALSIIPMLEEMMVVEAKVRVIGQVDWG